MLKPYWNIFHVSDFFIKKNKTFTFKLFFTLTNSVLPAISELSFPRTLTSHYIINVVTGIINESHWRLLDIVEFALSTFRTWNFITFWVDTTLILHQQAGLMISSFSRFIFSEIFCMQVSDFCLPWSFASVKCTWFKTFMSESIVRFKWPENESRILKWKCSENINLPSADQYRIFTRILQK